MVEELRLIDLAVAGHEQEALDGYRRLGAEWFAGLLGHDDDEELMRAFDEMNAPADGRPDEELAFMHPEMRIRFAQDLREALQSFDGLYYDNVATGGSWDIDLRQISQPTFLWYGDRDELLSIDHARWWHERIPRARLDIVPGAGHGSAYLPAERWEEMLTALRT